MKRTAILTLTLFGLLSCTKDGTGPENAQTRRGTVIQAGTCVKSEILDQLTPSGTRSVLWNEGDVIEATVTAPTTHPVGTLVVPAKYTGRAAASFELDSLLAPGQTLCLTYGAPEVPTEQTQEAPGKANIGGCTCAWSDSLAVPEGDEPLEFTLYHAPAFIRLVVSGSDFADSKLESVSLLCEGSVMTGAYTVTQPGNPFKEGKAPLIVKGKGEDRVTVKITSPENLGQGQTVWLCVLPGYYSLLNVSAVFVKGGEKTVESICSAKTLEFKCNTVKTLKVEFKKKNGSVGGGGAGSFIEE